MKYIYQFGIILAVSFLGEVLNKLIPLPVPASIYGLLIMLLGLKYKIIKLAQIKQVGDFLLEIMPLMFIPAAVGLLAVWSKVTDILLPLLVITLVTTIIVMVATGKTTQFIIHKGQSEKK